MSIAAGIPDKITSDEQLDELLSRPTDYVVETFKRNPGDVIVLGVAGKMGPTLARMAKRASDEAKTKRRVIGVAHELLILAVGDFRLIHEEALDRY